VPGGTWDRRSMQTIGAYRTCLEIRENPAIDRWQPCARTNGNAPQPSHWDG
jgi:hypothetical protein